MFNTRLTLVDQDSNRLFDVLDVNATPYGSETDDKSAEVLDNYTYDSNSIRTDWTPLLKDDDGKVKVSIGIPVDANKTENGASIQGVSVKIKCAIAAIQANKEVNGIAVVTDENGIEHDCITMADVVKHATNGAQIDIVRGDNGSYKDKWGIVDIDKDITINSADGEIYNFNDLTFNVVEGGSLTLKNLGFYGDSYINATSASGVTLENCVIKSAPQVLFDEYNRQPLERAAYIVATRMEQSGTLLKITDTTFDMGDGCAAVYLETALSDGSLISGNTFGKSGTAYEDYAVVFNSVAANAKVTVKNNTFYGLKGVTFAQKYLGTDTGFAVRLSENKMIYDGAGTAVLANAQGGIPIQLTDNGSLVNGEALGFANLGGGNTLFYGLNVTFGRDGLISGGTFKLSGALSEENNGLFFERYVTHGYSSGDFSFEN